MSIVELIVCQKYPQHSTLTTHNRCAEGTLRIGQPYKDTCLDNHLIQQGRT